MKKGILIAASALLMLSVSCKDKKKEDTTIKEVEKTETVTTNTTEPKKIKFELTPKSDSKVSGRVVFTEREGKVSMSAIMEGLTPGTHAIHIHEKADCSAADGISAGGHWNPTAQPHGKWGASSGFHKGDIGNFEVKADGLGAVTFETDQWCIDCDDDTKNIVGKAIIVHKGTDDFVSQPSGAAGARVSCGGIIQ